MKIAKMVLLGIVASYSALCQNIAHTKLNKMMATRQSRML
jgi:hypothetical protein